jgi:hypothetical protein
MTECCDRFGTCARVTVIIATIAGIVLQIFAGLECEFLKFSGSLAWLCFWDGRSLGILI